MPATKQLGQKKYRAVIDPDMKDYSKDPFFLKKSAEAKEALSKIKFPNSFFDKPEN